MIEELVIDRDIPLTTDPRFPPKIKKKPTKKNTEPKIVKDESKAIVMEKVMEKMK